MFSRSCFISQFKDYSKSVQNSRKLLFNAKFSISVVVKSSETENGASRLKVYKNVKPLERTSWLKKLTHHISKNRLQSVAAAGLVLNDSIDESPRNIDQTDIISTATDQTVAQILEIAEKVAPESSSIIEISPVATELVTNIPLLENPIVLSEPIPEPPAIPDISVEVIDQLNALGQPTFASLGLGGWTPVGIVQNCFEFLNVTLGVPWWGAIVIGTLVIRTCMFPLVIIAQRNAAKMNNNMPGLQAIQVKLSEARQCGNQLEAARYSQEMMLFMKEKEMNPLKNMVVPLAQMPVFISFFIGLRQMANTPVDSLRTGGLWWFTDLTVPDQYFLMPVITSLTLWATIELGTDTAKLSSQNVQTMKYVLRALPLIVLPFTINFPGAILIYWTSSNFVSLAQVGFLRIPAVRDYFKIDRQINIDKSNLPIKPKGFTEGIKDSWSNMKIVKELEERRRLDEIQFRRAGKAPIVKTYKYDPTQQTSRPGVTPISAKKR